MYEYAFLLALSLLGAILVFVGIAALLPLGMYQKLFGWVWPLGPSESDDKALERRLAGALVVTIGLIILRVCLMGLSKHMR